MKETVRRKETVLSHFFADLKCSLRLLRIMLKRKLNTLTLAQKAELINEIQRNPQCKKKDVALKYGIPPNTLSTILKNKETVLKRHASKLAPSCKRVKTCAFPDVEAALLKWFETFRNQNSKIPLSGVMLKEKAMDFARLLNVEGFIASAGWLEKFKARHKIVFRTLHGQAKDVSDETCVEWKMKLSDLLAPYKEKDVFNLDETGLFYKCMPNKTMMFKNETCSGGKLSKERLTLVVGANASGTEKLPLLVIGKYRNPRCLQNVKSLPVQYVGNKKAWMTLRLFEDYIRKLDSMFYNQKREVIIFIDNCTAHGEISNLKAIKLAFLPANTTAKLQPADQGIIKCLKHAYRKRLVRQAIDDIEKGVEHKINVLDAIRIISNSWDSDVTETVIKNCFKRCGLFKSEENEAEVTDEWDPFEDFDDVDWAEMKDFMSIDENVTTCEFLSDKTIVHAVRGESANADSDEDDGEEAIPPPTNRQAAEAANILQQYLENSENVDKSLFHCVHRLNDFLKHDKLKKCKQSKITAFFEAA